MVTDAERLAQARELLSKGDVAGARAALEAPTATEAAAAVAAAAAAPPENRTFEEVVLDAFLAFGNILGNHPVIAPILAELKDIVSAPLSPGAKT